MFENNSDGLMFGEESRTKSSVHKQKHQNVKRMAIFENEKLTNDKKVKEEMNMNDRKFNFEIKKKKQG